MRLWTESTLTLDQTNLNLHYLFQTKRESSFAMPRGSRQSGLMESLLWATTIQP